MLAIQENSREFFEADRHYCTCCHPPMLLIRRAGSLLASCLNTGSLYKRAFSASGSFTLVEGETALEGGRRPSLAVIDLSRESYS